MSIIVGYCEHDQPMVAAKEELSEREMLEDMASAYRLERHEDASRYMVGEPCIFCAARYLKNMKLLGLDSETKAETPPSG